MWNTFGINHVRSHVGANEKYATRTDKRNDSVLKEISAQKLCAGMVSDGRHLKAEGFFEGRSGTSCLGFA
jgi:hypothetical protein